LDSPFCFVYFTIAFHYFRLDFRMNTTVQWSSGSQEGLVKSIGAGPAAKPGNSWKEMKGSSGGWGIFIRCEKSASSPPPGFASCKQRKKRQQLHPFHSPKEYPAHIPHVVLHLPQTWKKAVIANSIGCFLMLFISCFPLLFWVKRCVPPFWDRSAL
jgi:hypothetical protein